MEDIQYIGECEHLFCNDIHDRRCIKRYFSLDKLNYGYERVAICNDNLKLLIQKGISELKNHRYSFNDNFDDSFIYNRLSKEIVSSFIKNNFYSGSQRFSEYGHDSAHNGQDFLKIPVVFTSNQRLGIHLLFTMEEALNIYIDYGISLRDSIIESLEYYIKIHSQYKKYKGLLIKFESIIKKIKNGIYSDEKKALIITELLTIVIQLKAKE